MEQPDYAAMFAKINQVLIEDWAYAQDYLRMGLNNMCHVAGDMVYAGFDPQRWPLSFERAAGRLLGAARDKSLALSAPRALGGWPGFFARAFDGARWVESALPESGVRPGDAIVKVGVRDVAAARSFAAAWLYGDRPERELWDDELRWAPSVTVWGRTVALRRFARPRPQALTLTDGPGRSQILRVNRLDDAAETARFVISHLEALRAAAPLVMDLRGCAGESAEAALILCRFLVKRETPADELWGAQRCQICYSAQNKRLIHRELTACMRDDPSNAPAYRAMALDARARPDGCRALLESPAPQEAVSPLGAGRTAVLTDLRCQGAAERLAQIASRSERAFSVGRETMGNFHTQLPLTLALGAGYALTYPAARDFAPLGQGVAPQITVAWTPGPGDKDLETALSV